MPAESLASNSRPHHHAWTLPWVSVTPDPYGATMLNILKFLLFVLRHGGETPTNVQPDASGSEPTNLQPLFPNPPPRLFNQLHHHHH